MGQLVRDAVQPDPAQPTEWTATYYFAGGAYEVSGALSGSTFTQTSTRKYYSIAGQMVAMEDSSKPDSGLEYFLSDHQGSTVAVADAHGTLLSEQRYLPFGGLRTLPGAQSISQTDFGYTGQRELDQTGLMDYKARFYDPYNSHFTQPDTTVQDNYNTLDLDRYAYARSNPVRYNDPSGHKACDGESANDCRSGNPTNLKKTDPLSTPKHDDCKGLDCVHKMTSTEKVGMAVAVAVTDIFVVLPAEAGLIVVTLDSTLACGAGVVLACVADIPLAAADVAVTDFAVSLNRYVYESISSEYKGQFKWTIIPAILDKFKRKE